MKKTPEIREKILQVLLGKLSWSGGYDDVAPFEWSCIRVEMPYKIIGNKDSNTKVSFIRTLLEHSIQFLTSATRKDGKGLKVENIGQSFQVL